MNILHISESYKFGGASQIMQQISNNLKSRGQNSYILTGYNPQELKKEKDDIILFPNSTAASLNKIFFMVSKRYAIPNLYTLFRILYIIRKKNIHVIHFHAMQGDFIGIREISWISKHFPVVWTFHDSWTFTGGCNYFWNCRNWINKECKNCKGLFEQAKDTNRYYKQKKKMLTGKNIQFITPSKWMLNNTRKSFFKRENIKNIYNGINLKQFYPINKEELRKKYNIPIAKHYIAFIAADSTDKYKGGQYLKAALSLIKNSEDYVLLIVGRSKQIVNIKDSLKVVHFGYIKEKKKLNEIYNMADVFILPSVQDNFPCVTLESMATGTPVIAFRTGGIPEQIDNECGWIVEEKTPEELAKKMDEVFQNKDFILEKGINCRRKVKEYFSEDKMIEEYIKIYKKVKNS